MDQEIKDRFYSKIEKTHSGCWNWTAALNSVGTPIFSFGRKALSARKISLQIKGIPANKIKTTKAVCKNSLCVNPEHLKTSDSRLSTAELFCLIKKKIKETRTDCWEWNGSFHGKAPSMILYKRTYYGVHRLLFSMVNGLLESHEVIRPICGNEKCINPKHASMVNKARCYKGHVKEGRTVRKGKQMIYCKVCQRGAK